MKQVPCYTILSQIYNEPDWQKFSSQMVVYIHDVLRSYNLTVNSVLDLGCGTGTFLDLWLSGDHKVGIDSSAEMVQLAKCRLGSNATIIQGDMTNFAIYKQFDLITCLFDTFNYITDSYQLELVLANIRNHLNANGLFVFDTNTTIGHKNWAQFKNKLVHEKNPRVICNGECDLSNGTARLIFSCPDEGIFEIHEQKSHDIGKLSGALLKAGFHILNTFKCFDFEQASTETARVLWVTCLDKKRIKEDCLKWPVS